MSHWARLDDNNLVIDIAVGDDDLPDEGFQWLTENLGGHWVQTSYNTRAGEHILGGSPFRGNYAGVGFTYDEDLDVFIPPQPHPSWVLDTETYQWRAPVDKPSDDARWMWDELSGDWVPFDAD